MRVPPAGTIRGFVAVDLDAPVLAAVQSLQRELARFSADVRWVRPEGMHVTLKFLGSVAGARLEPIRGALREIGKRRGAFPVAAHGIGAFPSLRRPRVVWVGLRGEELAILADDVEAALAGLGFAAERRGFTPHVTLGRVNSLRGWAAVEECLEAHRDDDFGTSVIRGLALYRSELRAGGSLYTPIWTIDLNHPTKGS